MKSTRASIQVLLFMVVLLGTLVLSKAAYTVQSSPPPAVVAEARRIAGVMGVTLPQDGPVHVSERVGRNTGHTLWEIGWKEATALVDATTTIVVEFHDHTASSYSSSSHDQNQPIVVTLADAEIKFNQLRQNLAIPVGDWRIQSSELVRPGGATGRPMYDFVLRLYASNKPVNLGHLIVFIEPYAGKVTDWYFQNSATFSAPQGTLLTKSQAQQYAEAAFAQYAGPSLVPTDATTPAAGGSGTWEPLSNSTTLSRINYRFIFPLKEIEGATVDDEPVRYEQEIWVDIDGETGEVAFIGNVLASAPLKKTGKLPTSPRLSLLSMMASAKAPDIFLSTIASGRSLPPAEVREAIAKKGKAKYLQFSQKTNKAEQAFSYDPAKRFLLWQSDSKGADWQGIALPKKQAEQLVKWLKTIPTTK